jgi:hypothetical protein
MVLPTFLVMTMEHERERVKSENATQPVLPLTPTRLVPARRSARYVNLGDG